MGFPAGYTAFPIPSRYVRPESICFPEELILLLFLETGDGKAAMVVFISLTL